MRYKRTMGWYINPEKRKGTMSMTRGLEGELTTHACAWRLRGFAKSNIFLDTSNCFGFHATTQQIHEKLVAGVGDGG